MNFLKDTCVFIHKIITPSKMIEIAQHCKKTEDTISITSIVLEELTPGKNISGNAKINAVGIVNAIEYSNKLGILEILNFDEYKNNYEKIRSSYYGFSTNLLYLQKLVRDGKIKKEDIKTLRYKDRGECSCLAVAMNNPKINIIVSEDKGVITGMPSVNIFNVFKTKYNIQIWNYNKWKRETRFPEINGDYLAK